VSLNLPKPIAAYFAADKSDGKAVARCFTESAAVRDEGRTYTGLAAIKRWKAETSRKYVYTSEPIAFEESDGKTVVTLRQLHPTKAQRDAGIGFGAVEFGYQTLDKLAQHVESSKAT